MVFSEPLKHLLGDTSRPVALSRQRKLLRYLVRECTWKNGRLGYTYNEPFDSLATIEMAEAA